MRPGGVPGGGVGGLDLGDCVEEFGGLAAAVGGCAEDTDGFEVEECGGEELVHCDGIDGGGEG